MAEWLAAVIYSLGTGITLATATVVAKVIIYAAVYAATSLISSALQSKPKKRGGVGGPSLSERTVTIRDPVASRKLIFGTIRVGGTIIFMGSTENDLYFHFPIALAGHRCKAIKEVYFDEDLAFDANGNIQAKYIVSGVSLARISKHLGGVNQNADPDLIAEFPGKWTENHRGRGICYLYPRLRYHSATYNTVPNVTSILDGWDEIYDPRDTSEKWTDNAALCVAKYLNVSLGAAYGTEIDTPTLIASANICDELVNIPGGTEKRYTLNGEVDTAADPRINIEQMLSAMAGRLIFSGGKWYVLAGAYETPEVTFDENDFRGNISVQPRIPKRDLFNAVRGVLVSPKNKWQPADFPPLVSDVFMDQDNGERIWADIELSFTTSETMAQRLAKIFLYSTREQITLSIPLSLKALRIRAGNTIRLTIPRMGWTEKVFLVTDWEFGISENEENSELLINVQLKETSPAVYDMNADEYDLIASAPDTDLPDASNVLPPGSIEITEELYITRDGAGVKAKAMLTWQPSAAGWVREYQVEYKLVTVEEYTVAGTTPDTSFDILDIKPGHYNFRVKAMTRISSSGYSNMTREIFGVLYPPAPVTGVTITAIGGLAIIRWARHPDVDVLIGGNIVFRHSKLFGTVDWNESTTIGDAVPGSDTIAVLPLKPGTYLLKARDSAGIFSINPATISTDAATVLTYGDVGLISEHPTFGGTHDGTMVDLGVLKIDKNDLNLLTENDLNLLTEDGQELWTEGRSLQNNEGTYYFASGFDFVTPRRVRLRTILYGITVQEDDLIDSRLANMDGWQTFDGEADGQADTAIRVRHTNDNPGGTPIWSDWNRLDSGEFYARAFQFNAFLTTSDVNFNNYINELSIKAEEVL